jgi:hypothetical protein
MRITNVKMGNPKPKVVVTVTVPAVTTDVRLCVFVIVVRG